MIFSLSSVIIPFPPCERKDRNNPAEIYGSPGAKLLCQSKWKTRAAVAEWDTERSRVSWPHGARPIDTDTAHYMSRLYCDQPRSVVRDTQHVLYEGEIVGRTLVWGWMLAQCTVMKYSVSTCNCLCGKLRKEKLWSQLRETKTESHKTFLNNYWLGCHEILYRQSRSPEDESLNLTSPWLFLLCHH